MADGLPASGATLIADRAGETLAASMADPRGRFLLILPKEPRGQVTITALKSRSPGGRSHARVSYDPARGPLRLVLVEWR